jgi:hypothetical protein
MPKGSSKRKKREDEAQSAARVMETIAAKHEEPEEAPVEITDEMQAAAAAFGRIGGKIDGPARAAVLTADERSAIARRAAAARWIKKKYGPLQNIFEWR